MSDTQVLHFFGGKGGAGKTTLSAAFALTLAEKLGKDKILLATFEPSNGFSDLFRKKPGPKPQKIVTGKGDGGLFIAELEQKPYAEAFVKAYGAALTASVTKGALLSEEDIQKVLIASTTQMGEVATLFALMDMLTTKEFDRIVIDGLGTAHTLRMLDQVTALRKLIGMVRGERPGKQLKSAPPRPPTPVDEFATKCEQLTALLTDPLRFAFHIVALAEPVPEAQTTRVLFNGLRERNIPIEEIRTNQIEDGQGSIMAQRRRGLQAPHVRKYQSLGVKVELVGRRVVGPRGLDDLKKFAKEVATGKETKTLAFSPSEGPPPLVSAPSRPPIEAPPLPPTRFIFFVGAGGVGKSSCAAAAAVTLTEKEGPVLLISTDPAHSLSDVLQSRLTDTETQVKGTKGLYAREIDIPNWFAVFKKRIKEKAEAAFGPEAKGQEFALDRELIRNLLDAAPTGMDELAAMSSLTDALVQERFKRIVIDPAPSGHTFRILELPAVAKEWFTTLHTVFSKYRAKGLGPMADEIAAQLKHIARFEAAIVNPSECRFVVVTRGEDMAVPGVERLFEYLKGMKLPVERVLLNRLLPKTTCAVTEERRNHELEAAKVFEKKVGLPLTVTPALGRHPAGLRELKQFRTSWYALTATTKIKAA